MSLIRAQTRKQFRHPPKQELTIITKNIPTRQASDDRRAQRECDATDAGDANTKRAHRARLNRGVERAFAQRVITDKTASARDGDDLGVPRFIGEAHDLIGRLRDDLPPTRDQAPDRKLASCRAGPGKFDAAPIISASVGSMSNAPPLPLAS